MHNLHLLIMIAGTILSVGFVLLYYWAQERLRTFHATMAVFVGFLLGLAAIGVQYESYFIFSFVIASYLAGFIYLKTNAEFNAQTESIMASLFVGAVMGIAGLVGCVVCHH